jgi:translocation and assembly module TamB
MNKQIKYLFGVLVLLLIAAYFLSLLSGLPQYFKDDIIAFLEERFSGEISFSSVSLWPLNRIRLSSVSFVEQNGNTVKIERLNLDYNLNFRDVEKLIEFRFIEAINAEIMINEDFLTADSKNEAEGLTLENSEAEGLNFSNFDLPKFLEDINVNIKNSQLTIQNQNYDLKFDNLNLGIKASNSKDYDLNLSTSVLINNLNYSDFNLSDLEGKKIELQLQRKNDRANLYFKTNNLDLKPFINLLQKKSYSFQAVNIDLNTVEGFFSAKGEVEFGEKEIIDYKSEINFSELDFSAFYQQDNQSEKLNLSFNDLELILSGPEFNLAAIDNQILLDNNLLEFSLKLDQKYQYQLELNADNFNYNYDFLSPEFNSGDISFDLKLEGDQQQLKRADADITAENIMNKYANISDSHIILKLIKDEIFVEKAELELDNNSTINLQASYNLKDGNYLLSAEAEEMKISKKIISLFEEYNLSDRYLEELQKIEDDSLDFILDIAGYYNRDRGISAAGDLDFNFNFKEKNSEIKLESKFWYTDNKLFFDSLKLYTDFIYLDLLGEIDFAAENFDLRYAAKNIEPVLLNNLFDLNFDLLNNFNPTINYVEGRLADSFNNPTVSIDLEMDELEYQNYIIKDIKMRAVYEDNNLELAEARASINQGLFRAKGEIRDLSAKAILDLNIRSENLYFQDIAFASKTEFPLTGQLQLNADLSGELRDYNLDFRINTSNPILTFGGQEFELSNLSSTIKKENGKFEIENLSFEHQNLIFEAAGSYNQESGFDLNYYLEGIEVKNYLNNYPEFAEKVSGSLKMDGVLSGQIEEIRLNFNIAAEALYYEGFELNIQENDFEYSVQNDQLNLNQFNFSFASGKYQLEGQAFNLSTVPQSELEFKLIEVPTQEIFQKYLEIYPFAQEIILRGESQIKTKGSEYNVLLDIDAYLGQVDQSSFNLNGEIGREISLNFNGSELPLAFSAEQYDFNLDLKAELDCSGNISGGLMTPILNLNHNLTNIEINNTEIESIAGNILVENSSRFSASETINFIKGGNLNIDGSYSFKDDELSLSSSLQSLPVSFILSFFGDQISGNGKLNGNLRAEGNMDSPKFSGGLAVKGDSLELGIWAPIENYEAEINFQNDRAVLKNVKGQFVDGNFEIGGSFNLLDLNNFWNLSLTGQKLYFDYGSLKGVFDTNLNFSGPLLDPLLKGEIRLYDFIVGIPFEWSAAQGQDEVEGEGNGENAFVPRINLKLIPENNVRVKNSNMDILVRNGDLILDFNQSRDNSLMMEGRLRSTEGRFNYYNSRFTLNNAEALFTPVDEGDIPNLLVNATTYAGGREININLNGPADNMRISFSSNPEMTEEEILNLLSSRGALGSAIIGGEDIGVQQIILQELIRIVNGFLQQDVISNIESDFRSALSLDRIEIDTIQYGLEREFSIYLGKNLSNRFYLEYAAFFGEDVRDNEISFQYRLNDITTLKGSYFGDKEYQITLENEIEF